jgi:hypothetical protein
MRAPEAIVTVAEIFARLPPSLSKLVSGFGYSSRNPTNEASRAIASLVLGYGASIMKASGFDLDAALQIIRDKWPTLQGQGAN